MKKLSLILCMFLIPALLMAQEENEENKDFFKSSDHYMTFKVDNEEFEANPRKVKVGRVVYYTGNIVKPETMLRVWIGAFDKKQTEKSGNYIIFDANYNPSKKEMKEKVYHEKYDGYAVIRYVLETKSPRMRYHVGDSQNNEEILVLKNDGDGKIEITFNAELKGTHWKERDINTVLGGVGRLKGKFGSKIMSQATGFDWNIDPEGNGYRKVKDEDDTINLTDVKMVVKLKE